MLLPPEYPRLSVHAAYLLLGLVNAAGPSGIERLFRCIELDQPGWHVDAQELKSFNQEHDTYDVREYLNEMESGAYIQLERHPRAWLFTLTDRALDWRQALRPLFPPSSQSHEPPQNPS